MELGIDPAIFDIDKNWSSVPPAVRLGLSGHGEYMHLAWESSARRPGEGRTIRRGRQDTIGVRMYRQNKEADAFPQLAPGGLRDQEPDCSMKR
jgi:hypothetical protein